MRKLFSILLTSQLIISVLNAQNVLDAPFIFEKALSNEPRVKTIFNNWNFIDEANNFNGIKIQETVNRHLKDGKAPVGHVVLTKNLIKRYPNWLQLEF